MPIIAPSVLNANFINLEKEIEMLNQSEADWIHLDVMDGNFVPNISFGFPIVEAIHKQTKKILDVHLMIVNPDRYIERFCQAGADYITVHYEACPVLEKVLCQIHEAGCKSGVAINPDTPVKSLIPFLRKTDMVLLMSVYPGFGGQKFIPETFERVQHLKMLIEEQGLDTLIEIDGGVNTTNGQKLIEAGADVLVAGSLVFSSDEPLNVISDLKRISA
ncbi:MAG: ribulose-phosphate 3-epimerase [Cyclobacteriaceae bacterium]